MKPRILFVSEAVSIAHVARPAVLARMLPESRFDVHFASSGQFSFCLDNSEWPFHQIKSPSPQTFLKRLGAGRPLYDSNELDTFIAADVDLIAKVRPTAIVSDFRLSLGVSARLAGVPLLTLCNAHWSPHLMEQRPPPAPDLPLARVLGYTVFDVVFGRAWPIASRYHVTAANRVRIRHGLAPYRNLRELYCDGDRVLYADAPQLFPMRVLPSTHHFIGPVVWSPDIELPAWWPDVTHSPLDLVYVTFGSTGDASLLPVILSACRAQGFGALVATAGRRDISSDPPWVYAADFIPGGMAAAISELVICNGGSATAHQALAQGRPVLGICSNLDQVMTMQAITKAGAGESMRAREADLPRVSASLARLRVNPAFASAAKVICAGFEEIARKRVFAQVVDDVCRLHVGA